ncbi:MAG TPA: DNA-3-methyladenine glycosylase [Candidatus Dormibacteraeota bacterium]|nr:DNA-3-methyladenine glycosylase [Candidatus Dormibacteraeota bacterium]
MAVLDRTLLAGATLEAARSLLGSRLLRDGPGDTRRTGRIVEVEAYIGEADRASHARFGRTARNEVMFGPPGRAYVYLVYGMYDCLNVVTEPAGSPAAVLIRAVEPVDGVAAMRASRLAVVTARHRAGSDPERERRRLEAVPDHRLASGPGLVAAAFGIVRTHTGTDLCDPRSCLRLEAAPADEAPPDVEATPRVGVAYSGEPWAHVPWRFVIAGDPSVSGRGGRPAVHGTSPSAGR